MRNAVSVSYLLNTADTNFDSHSPSVNSCWEIYTGGRGNPFKSSAYLWIYSVLLWAI